MPESESIMTRAVVKRSLILAGGGVRMSYQAGVLQALAETNIKFDHIDGTSGGVFNAAMIASGLNPEEMSERWRRLNILGFMSPTPVNNYLKLTKMVAWGDADGIRNKVFPALGIDVEKIRNNGISATFNVCNFSNKTVEAVAEKEVTTDYLIAGVSLPIFMPALKINNHWYSDAVWIKDANLMEAVRRGAEEIWLVWAIGNTHEYLPGSFNQYVHMIEMSANGGLLEEFEQLKLINSAILAGHSAYGQKVPIKLHVIKPQFPLPLDPDLFLKKIDARSLINMGYADGKRYMERITPTGDAIDKLASRMNEPGVVFSFRHHYRGHIDADTFKSPLDFYPYFTYRKTDSAFSLHFCSSINFKSDGIETPTYNNSIQIKHLDGKMTILLYGQFQKDGKNFVMKASVLLHSPTDWLLGLEFKKIKFEITSMNDAEGGISTPVYLYQKAMDRFRNMIHSKVDNYSFNGNGKMTRLEIIKKLYHHEV